MTAKVSPIRPGVAAASALIWLSPEQVCERVPGMTVEILSQRRKSNLAPRYFKPSPKTVIYEQGEVDEWVRATASTPRH